MRDIRKVSVLACAILVASVALPAQAGKLDSFENSVSGSKSSSGSSSDDSGSQSSFESSTSSSKKRSRSRRHSYYVDPCWYCRYHHHCLFHGFYHVHDHGLELAPPRVDPSLGTTNPVPEISYARLPNSPLLPMARIDVAWQSVEDDVDAYDYALEVGYSALAIRGRLTRYEEDDPGDTLDLSSVLLLWRVPLARDLELDAGLGGAELTGNDSQSGLDVSLALRGWIPDRHLGFEYRGEFMDIGEGIDSNEVSLLLHLKWVAIRGGYRWVHTVGNSLDGPFVGAALSF